MALSRLKKYNLWFLLPFLLWLAMGIVLLKGIGNVELFRLINTHNAEILDQIMFAATKMGQVEVIFPVLALIMLCKKYRNLWYFLTAILCNIIPLLTQKMLKYYFDLPRPLYFFYHTGWLHFNTWWPQLFYKSFPSGHTEGAFSFFYFLSLLLSVKKQHWGIVFFMLACLVAYSRIYLAAHFFADVYAGSMVGVIVTGFVFAIMNRFRSQLGMEPVSSLLLQH